MNEPTLDQPDESGADFPSELDPATFDLNAWIGGVSGTERAVTLYQRADLLAEVDKLERELRLAEKLPAEDRGMNDPTPEGVRRRLEQVAKDFEASALVFKVQGRSAEARERITKRLKKQGVTDEETVGLHLLADAVVQPQGVTADLLRALGERSESQLRMLFNAAGMANAAPPRVDVPFSRESSAGRNRQRPS